MAVEAQRLRRQCPHVAIRLLPSFGHDLGFLERRRAFARRRATIEVLERRPLPRVRHGTRIAVAQAHAADAPASLVGRGLRQLGRLVATNENCAFGAVLPDFLGKHGEQLGWDRAGHLSRLADPSRLLRAGRHDCAEDRRRHDRSRRSIVHESLPVPIERPIRTTRG